MKVDTLDSKSDNSAYNLFLKNSPFTKKPQFVVYQKMSDYSFFVTGSRVDFAFYKLETGKYLVEVIGQIGVKKSAPSFVDYKMIKDFPEKMKYLKNSLAKVFISSKL